MLLRTELVMELELLMVGLETYLSDDKLHDT